MREPYTQLYVHLVWPTWDRLPLLTGNVRRMVYACIKSECVKLRAELMAIGGTEDHVHILARVPSALPVAALVKQMKGSSSHLVTHTPEHESAFKWQGAYGAFSVSKSLVPFVCSYIRKQEEHHREGTTDRDLEIAWEEDSGLDS